MAHVAVVGAGIAGMCAADALVQTGHAVTLVRAPAPQATALAALVNPFTGPNASPAWRYEDALRTLGALLVRMDASLLPGLVRPARDAKQAAAFRARAAEHPTALVWHDDAPPPDVHAPHGWLDVRVGGVWPRVLDDLARHIARLTDEGLRVVEGTVVRADESPDGVRLTFNTGTVRPFDAAVLACGAGLPALTPSLAAHLHTVKGEVFAAQCAASSSLPAISAGGYLVPVPGPSTVHLGGTYDHDWTDLIPDEARGETLRARMEAFAPHLGPLVPGSGRAGLRVQRPRLRRPLLQPLGEAGRLWAFGALGAKGLLHAPLVASMLPDVLEDPQRVPGEVRV